MTKMAAMPIYGKNLSKIFFSGTGKPISMKFGMKHWGLLPIIVCSDNDPEVTLTYFTARSNFGNLGFSMRKVKTVDFSESLAASDLKGSRRGHLIEYMNICEY